MNVIDAIRERRSIRKYTQTEIPDEILSRIIDAAQYAPSSRSKFPVEMVVVRDREMLGKLAKCKTFGSAMLKDAACAIVVCGDTAKSDAWIEDCSVALSYMQLEAVELGVGTCWVQCRMRSSLLGKPTNDYLRDLLGLPDTVEPEAILSLGIPDGLPPARKAQENNIAIHSERY